jgi:hypothetical protein
MLMSAPGQPCCYPSAPPATPPPPPPPHPSPPDKDNCPSPHSHIGGCASYQRHQQRHLASGPPAPQRVGAGFGRLQQHAQRRSLHRLQRLRAGGTGPGAMATFGAAVVETTVACCAQRSPVTSRPGLRSPAAGGGGCAAAGTCRRARRPVGQHTMADADAAGAVTQRAGVVGQHESARVAQRLGKLCKRRLMPAHEGTRVAGVPSYVSAWRGRQHQTLYARQSEIQCVDGTRAEAGEAGPRENT